MLALKTERRILLLRVKPRVNPADCEKPTSLAEIVAILQSEYEKKSARCHVSKSGSVIADDDSETGRDEKNQIYIAQIRHDAAKGTVTFLINRGNPNAVSPALLTPASNDVTYIQPEGEQTPGASAHLVISTTWEDGAHRAGFEKMAHVATGLTQSALNTMVERVTSKDPKYLYQ